MKKTRSRRQCKTLMLTVREFKKFKNLYIINNFTIGVLLILFFLDLPELTWPATEVVVNEKTEKQTFLKNSYIEGTCT